MTRASVEMVCWVATIRRKINLCTIVPSDTALWFLTNKVLYIIYTRLRLERLGKLDINRPLKFFLREYGSKIEEVRVYLERVLNLCGYVNDMCFKSGEERKHCCRRSQRRES